MRRVIRFGSSGSWTVPSGVYYVDVYGSGGGAGNATSGLGVAGSSTTVALTGGTVTLPGRPAMRSTGDNYGGVVTPGKNGTGSSATFLSSQRRSGGHVYLETDADEQIHRGGGAVTPGTVVTITIGAGGSSGANGGSGYAVIEYEV